MAEIKQIKIEAGRLKEYQKGIGWIGETSIVDRSTDVIDTIVNK